jgi:2-polyprenyl-3-methyl-5-hydroxy-6-metoxy-1,4-benzoquinol methylase
MVDAMKSRIGYRFWTRKVSRHYDGNIDRILDIGSGDGSLLNCLEDWYTAEIVGGDIKREYVQYESEKVSRSTVLQFNGDCLPFARSSFDLIFCTQVIEHVSNPEALLAEVSRVLTESGIFVVTTPNPNSLAARLLDDDWQGYKHDHVSLRSPSEWRESLKQKGFYIQSEGTTLFNGFPWLGEFPLVVFSWIPLAIFGYFPWESGESYKIIVKCERHI